MSILCYHAVDPRWDGSLSIDPLVFERQCVWLSRHRSVVRLSDVAARVTRRGLTPAGVSAVTFDDGFASVYEYALRPLLRHGIQATVFVVSAAIDGRAQPHSWVTDPPAHPTPTLSAEQILEMHAAGIEFASHTADHVDLTALTSSEIERDLRDSRERLEDLLHGHVRSVAYPWGRHDARVRTAAARAGYRHGFSLPEGPEPVGPLAIPRVGVYRGQTEDRMRFLLRTTRAYQRLRTSTIFPKARRTTRRVRSWVAAPPASRPRARPL